MGIVAAGLGLAGLGSSIYGDVANQQAMAQQQALQEQAFQEQQLMANNQLNLQKSYLSKMSNPANVAAGINKLVTPMSGALQSSIANQVQAEMATRGLATAPALFSEAMAQAMAPYQMNEQQLASQNYFSEMGLPLRIPLGNISPYTSQPGSSMQSAGLLGGMGSALGSGLGAYYGSGAGGGGSLFGGGGGGGGGYMPPNFNTGGLYGGGNSLGFGFGGGYQP